MSLIPSTRLLTRFVITTKDDILKAWTENPGRLINFLGLMKDRSGRGICCPYCGSGSGSNGTGMHLYHTEKTHYARLKCFASNCEANKDPFDLVRDFFVPGGNFTTCMNVLAELYYPLDSEFDSDVPFCIQRRTIYSRSLDPAQLMPVYTRSIEARKACPEWQQRIASLMGLPVSAFNRPDIGKAYLVDAQGNSDAFAPTCGDLVTYNLLNGCPIAVKVRHTPGLNSYHDSMLYYKEGAFGKTSLSDPLALRGFRMSGKSGHICFGHDSIKDAELVVIVEGQSDVLAVVAAFQELGLTSYTAIGRDSSGHRLRGVDLNALFGKRIIYAKDYDDVDSAISRENTQNLYFYKCEVRVWSAPSASIKDARAYYIKHGAKALVESLLAAPLYTPTVIPI